MTVAPAKAARRLPIRACTKPWGRTVLGPWGLGLANDGAPIGEIHHGANSDSLLLLKTLFTAEALSVQVHPSDRHAAQRGAGRGKDEAWVVLDAEPGARIGLGLAADCDAATLRAAAADGTIVDLLRWHDCRAGDVLLAPAGTIHAIGAGVTLFEIQQNSDVTYRLYDYGRGRGLHIEDGIAVADNTAWRRPPLPQAGMTSPQGSAGRELLMAGPNFVLERVSVRDGVLRPSAAEPVSMAVVSGDGRIGDDDFAPGEVWEVTAPVTISGPAVVLFAHAGRRVRPEMWTPA